MKIDLREFPEEKRVLIEPIIERCRPILPNWLTLLVVYFVSTTQDDGTVADCHVSPEYRNARIRVFGNFFEAEYADRRLVCIAHEFFHIHTADFVQCGENIIQSGWKDEGPFKTFATEQLRLEREKLVEDLAFAFARMIGEARKD